jgi:hypothetical protein
VATLPVFGAADISAFFKSRYPQRKLENLVAYGKPTLEAIKRSDELTGASTLIPIELDSPQGVGNSLQHAAAQGDDGSVGGSAGTGGGAVYGKSWTITRAKYYAVLYLDAETMMASRNDEGAFFKQRERNVERIMEQLGQQLEMALWSDGTASLGTITGDPSSGTTFTMTYAQDAIKFHRGMKILFYADSSGVPGSVRAGGLCTVSAVDEDTGIVTVAETINAAVATGDHVVRGTADAAATSDVNLWLKGIPAWIPSTVSATTHFGVDRTAAPQKLAGHRQTWLGSIEETVKRLDTKMSRVSQKGKVLWLSYQNFNRLEIELGARGYRMEDGGEGKFGRVALKMSTPGGGITVKAGPYVPEGAGFLLDMDTWKLCTLGAAPHLVEDDGNSALRLPVGTGNDGDGIEIRWRYFAQLVCTNPYTNGRFTIS